VIKLISTLVLFAAFAGQSQGATAVAKSDTGKNTPGKAAPATARQVPDAQIERNIKAKFARSKINAEHFTVSVQSGVATIEGKTEVIQHKGVATRLAKTGGALAVQNKIVVSDAARAKAAARLAKGRETAQLARATVIPAPPAQTAKTK
jgi:hypothetical protein